jgi:hypothetical protein
MTRCDAIVVTGKRIDMQKISKFRQIIGNFLLIIGNPAELLPDNRDFDESLRIVLWRDSRELEQEGP